MANDVSVNISYVIKDGDGTHSSATTLTLSTSDRSEVSATNDTANVSEGYWQAGTTNTSYTETVTTQSWSATAANHEVHTTNPSINPDWLWGNDSTSSDNFAITADASHPASIAVQIDVNGYRNSNDDVEIRLYNGTTLVGTIDVAGDVNNSAYTFNVTSSGNYHVELFGHDGTTWNNLTAHIDSVSYTAYSSTSTPHTISVAAPAADWHAATTASGNVVTSNDSPGSEGAFITLVSSSIASNVAVNAAGVNINGTYGTLHIEADGDYTYTPTAIDHPAGAVDSFTYTLAQADGDKATATLTVTVANHDYPTTGSDGVNDLLYGSASADTLSGLGGNDHLLGNGGDDTLYGGIGTDILEGGEGKDTLYGGTGSDALLGGNGADILVGGQGDDILTGGLGSDIFRYQSGDLTNAPYGDVIKDFTVNTVANGGDVLDVKDLLPTGLTNTQLENGGYLKFEYVSGDSNTVVVKLSIDTDGAAGSVSSYTPLATITMTGAGTINPSDILHKLLANGEIQH